ncbi:MAG TPA: GDSL-type esterase/lipase family protein [Thermoanaerobaculia bacterium]|nr:GDSL-type esterase/lipase family protein [Thermoanaerobaculia bacterium]
MLKAALIGDSLAYGTGDESGGGIAGYLEHELPIETRNLAASGAQTADLTRKLQQASVRRSLAEVDAIILSIGANDLFRAPGAREQTLRAPLAVAQRILARIETIVGELHAINEQARIFILGGYNPVPNHPLAGLIDQYLGLWDATLASRFEHNRLVSVVTMSDLVVHGRLSRFDGFHPGSAAYREIAKRIAAMLQD